MFGNKSGFTLLEMMIVVAIFGIMAIIIIPRFSGRNPAKQREQFVAELNRLLRYAAADALASSAIFKVTIDVAHKRIGVEQQTAQKNDKGEFIYRVPRRPYALHPLPIPAHYHIQNIVIEGFDEMTRLTGGKTTTVWFYLMPQGVAQSVVINMVDRTDTNLSSKGQPVGLVLNPLSVQFRAHNAFA